MTRILLLTALLASPALAADAPNLAFRPGEKGFYEFDTGVLRGKMKLDGRWQGICPLFYVPTGAELTKAPGVFSFYRVLATDKRYGDAARDWPWQGKVRDDGALEITFPGDDRCPLAAQGVFRWTAPDTLDMETTIEAKADFAKFELFMSNYVAKSFDVWIYTKPNRFSKKAPASLVRGDWNEFVDGCYLMYPRDLAATQLIYDGRWEYPPNPVQWAVSRHMAGPLAVRRDEQSGLSMVWMSPPDDVFAVAVPYNKTPPDGVAGHSSVYFCHYGRDLAAGAKAVLRSRLVVKKDLTNDAAVKLYEEYVAK
jgi:hypothetical protein